MALQFITTPAGDRMVVMPEDEYRKLAKAAEMAEDEADIAAVERFHARLASGDEELIPAEFVNRMLDGENRIKVWREYRAMTLRDLAAKADVSPAYLSQIESGKRDGTFDTIKKIAAALDITVDELA
ncbi:helix-turn-helix transcriptional regulator [Sinorhizobium sp. 7-81]|uniref:helix-turn-helix domain-containing protein n=1 Tax=Sinorhizobium sp. 8-89 TaxID=3049089 RepID=UPI0024C39191|nr:helix-turn-helix transcriptional regulator [Sinorhizobium sp. 8-89]MDK1490507.1 helix-turn-helix transcriptional regulator [Sinorhizobium sp. 8-89]